MSVAPESTMPVACREVVVCFLLVKVGLKLANKLFVEFSFMFKLLLILHTAPHRHKALRHPGGRFSLFLASS